MNSNIQDLNNEIHALQGKMSFLAQEYLSKYGVDLSDLSIEELKQLCSSLENELQTNNSRKLELEQEINVLEQRLNEITM